MADLAGAFIASVVALLEADTGTGGLRSTDVDSLARVQSIGRLGDKDFRPSEGGFRSPMLTVDIVVDDLIAQGVDAARVIGAVQIHTSTTGGMERQNAIASRVRSVVDRQTVNPTGFQQCYLKCLFGRQRRSMFSGLGVFEIPFRTVVTAN